MKEALQLDANAVEEAITQAMLDSGASKTFVNSRRGLQLTSRSDEVVITAGSTKLQVKNTGLLATRALFKGAREAIVVPGMSQPALMSVSTLADNGYTAVFLPDGVDIYQANNVAMSKTAPPALQGWRDGRGLPISPGLDVAETATSVRTPLLMCTKYCGTPYSESNTPRTTPPLRQCKENTLQPSDKQAIKAVEQAKLPRVAQQSKFSQHVPRVHFNDAPSTVYDPPPRLIVALLEKQHVAKSIVAPPLKPIIKPPKYVDESIAVAHDVSNIKHWSTNPLPIV
jgi:hypothetical protein